MCPSAPRFTTRTAWTWPASPQRDRVTLDCVACSLNRRHSERPQLPPSVTGPVQRTAHAEATAVEDLRVKHRRLEVTVPEQVLYRADIRTALHQMGGEGCGIRRAAPPQRARRPLKQLAAPRSDTRGACASNCSRDASSRVPPGTHNTVAPSRSARG